MVIRWNRLFGLLAFVVALVAGATIYWRLEYYRVWLSSPSPNGKYTVEMTGDKGRGGILTYAVVKYNLLVDGKPITRDRLAHYGDAMDISFELEYPEHAWIDERTLRFWSNEHRCEDNLDTLVIANNTAKKIRFLRIEAWDMFFVFDVQPNSELEVTFTHRTESKQISAEGEFEDGSLIDYGVSFPGHKRREPLGYCLTINYDHVSVNECGQDDPKPAFSL